MTDIAEYTVQIRGEVTEDEINTLSPLQMTGRGMDAAGTYFSLRTDQSGLIGLLRHLHGLGFFLLSFQRSN